MMEVDEIPVSENDCPIKEELSTDPETGSTNQESFHIPDIVDSITPEYIANFQPAYKRYFQAKYFTKFSTPEQNLDTCLRVHSNKICVLYISSKHSVFQKGQTIKHLNFQISAKVNRLNNRVSGKGKRGAQFLQPESIMCFIETEDGGKYPVYAGIHGKLLEINSEIVNNPNLLKEDNLSNGFIAVVLSDLRKFDDCMKQLKTSEEYDNCINI